MGYGPRCGEPRLQGEPSGGHAGEAGAGIRMHLHGVCGMPESADIFAATASLTEGGACWMKGTLIQRRCLNLGRIIRQHLADILPSRRCPRQCGPSLVHKMRRACRNRYRRCWSFAAVAKCSISRGRIPTLRETSTGCKVCIYKHGILHTGHWHRNICTW